ncbi:hypothetical protein U1Q18_046220 [Sarracenia purpurea var. burkii]
MVELGVTARWGLRLGEGRRSARLAARRGSLLGGTCCPARLAARRRSLPDGICCSARLVAWRGSPLSLGVKVDVELQKFLTARTKEAEMIVGFRLLGPCRSGRRRLGWCTCTLQVSFRALCCGLYRRRCSVGGRLRRRWDGCLGRGRRSGGQWCRLKGPRGGARAVVVPDVDDGGVGEMAASGLGL